MKVIQKHVVHTKFDIYVFIVHDVYIFPLIFTHRNTYCQVTSIIQSYYR